MNELLQAMAIIVPFVIGLTEMAKRTGKLPDRYVPFVSVALGVALAFLIAPSLVWRDEVVAGIMAGLSASGLWSGTKAVAGR